MGQSTTSSQTRPRVQGQVKDFLQDRHSMGWTAAQAHEELLRLIEKRATAGKSAWRCWTKWGAARAADTSGHWTLADSTPEEARLVLDVLAAVIKGTQGRIHSVTKHEAAQLPRLAAAAPALGPFEWWRLAREYLARAAHQQATADLDGCLAFAPWRSPTDRERYEGAVAAGWVPLAPSWLVWWPSGVIMVSEPVPRALAPDTKPWSRIINPLGGDTPSG
jgi:hypothetical protein